MLSGVMNISPFNELSRDGQDLLKDNLRWEKHKIGERLYRQDELPTQVNLIGKGEARLLVESLNSGKLITLNKAQEGDLIGWAGLLRGEACETVQASTELETISIPSEIFIRLILTENNFDEYFGNQSNYQESWIVIQKYLEKFPYENKDLDAIVRNACRMVRLKKEKDDYRDENDYLLSTAQCNIASGSNVSRQEEAESINGFGLRKRILEIPKTWKEGYLNGRPSNINIKSREETRKLNVEKKDLYKLGILEADTIQDKDRYPILKGKGMVEEGLALVSMIARSLDLPMRKELCKKFLEQRKKR